MRALLNHPRHLGTFLDIEFLKISRAEKEKKKLYQFSIQSMKAEKII
jgi:hypothetical protein